MNGLTTTFRGKRLLRKCFKEECVMGMTVSGSGMTGSTMAMPGTTAAGKTKSSGRNSRTKKTGLSGPTQNKTKKKLKYNHREISGQLAQAKKAQSAATVMVRAKTRLASLLRCVGSGQYDYNELNNAIAHARRMVRCAQLKVKNLKEEEMEAKGHQKKNNGKKAQKEGEIKRRVAQKERELEQKLAMEHLQEVMREKTARQRMMNKRRMHRREEQGKINEADMKYIKGLMEKNNDSDRKDSPDMSGVWIDLSAAAAAQSEAALLKQQIEQEVRAEVEAEMSMDCGSVPETAGGMNMGTPDMPTSEAASAEAAVSVDICL